MIRTVKSKGQIMMSQPDTEKPSRIDYASVPTRRRSCFFDPVATILLLIGLMFGVLAGICGLNPVEGSVVSDWLVDRPSPNLALVISAYPGLFIGLVLCELLHLPSYTLAICIGQACVYWPLGALLACILRRARRGSAETKSR